MKNFYIANIIGYVNEARLPLWVEHVERGKHPARLFHNHNFSEIAIVLYGQAQHLVNKAEARIRIGDVLVIHPGVSHAYDNTGDMELINIVYDPKKLSLPMLDSYSLPLFKFLFPADTVSKIQEDAKPIISLTEDELCNVHTMITRLDDELRSFNPGNSFLSLALFMEIIILLARHDASMMVEYQFRFLVGNLVSFINKNFRRHIAVDEMAKVSGMSKRNLFRCFRNATGYSPIEYLRQIRLQCAAKMLLNSDFTINEIATESGFCDSNYLCRVFREEMKTSPKQFRLSKREDTE